MRYVTAHRVHISLVSHSLVERLLQIQVYPRVGLTNIGERRLITLVRSAPQVKCGG
jgi:hypothetical protein